MPLYDRLMGLAQPKLPVHQFMAMVAERVRNDVTTQQVTDAFALAPDEVTDATTLTQRVTQALLTKDEVHDVLLLAEAAIPPYTTVAAVKARLGV
jgi:hypothetical protein